jgi:hypothetical protein
VKIAIVRQRYNPYGGAERFVARAPALGAARDQRHLGAAALERRQGARDEALGAAVGVVALADDGDPHRASSSRARPRPVVLGMVRSVITRS